jgi:MYXO-CTERM domain-containing protein
MTQTYTRLAALAAGIALASDAGAATLIDLGTLGGSSSQATGINASGQVSGSGVTASGDYRGFVSTPSGLQVLPTLGGGLSAGNGLNDAGAVVGTAYAADGSQAHAVVYGNGGMKDLGSIGGGSSYGLAINNAGQVTGNSVDSATWSPHAFVSTATGLKDLGTLGGYESYGRAINSAGVVAGYSTTSMDLFSNDNTIHAFMADGSGMHDLGTFADGTYSYAYGINDAGQITGTADIGGFGHAYVTTGNGLQDLGLIAGAQAATGDDINNKGQVVGNLAMKDGSSSAFIYSATTGMVDLNTFVAGTGWHLQSATSINDLGQITGYGTIGGQVHPFVLEGPLVVAPTPLPPTAWMALAGLGWLGLVARRRAPR